MEYDESSLKIIISVSESYTLCIKTVHTDIPVIIK